MNLKTLRLDLKCCDEIPEGALRPDLIYYSEKCHVAVHLCACGCGSRVTTPIAYEGQPSDIRSFKMHLTSDKLVTLDQVICNWHLHCNSRYYIRGSLIEWA